MRSLYPAFAGLRFRRSPERTFVSSGGRLRRFGAAQCPSSEPTGSDTACLFCGTWYGHEIEMYTVEQGEKRDKRQ